MASKTPPAADVLAQAQLVLARAIEVQAETLRILLDNVRSRTLREFDLIAQLYPAEITVKDGNLYFSSEGKTYINEKVLAVTDVLQLEFRLSDGQVHETAEHKVLIEKLAEFALKYSETRQFVASKISCCRGG